MALWLMSIGCFEFVTVIDLCQASTLNQFTIRLKERFKKKIQSGKRRERERKKKIERK